MGVKSKCVRFFTRMNFETPSIPLESVTSIQEFGNEKIIVFEHENTNPEKYKNISMFRFVITLPKESKFFSEEGLKIMDGKVADTPIQRLQVELSKLDELMLQRSPVVPTQTTTCQAA